MSSTTDSADPRGQILVIFAASLLVVFGIAALVFDGGLMLLEKRTQQNAADAAALAGARFLPGDPASAEAAALAIATENGYTDGTGNQEVTVNIPPVSGPHAGNGGFVEVLIDDETVSFFAGIWGIFGHDVGSRAVAANIDGPLGPFGLLALNDTECAALKVSGNGVLQSDGDIQVNSTCTPNAMHLIGTGEIVTAPDVACNVTGGYQEGGASDNNCPVAEGVTAIPDPLLGLDEPPIPTDADGIVVYPPSPVQIVGSRLIPAGCPGGSTAATHDAPVLCEFTGAYNGTEWRLFPGYYPGGIALRGGRYLLEPGIYYMGGGGFATNGASVSVLSVEAGTNAFGGGVMIFNGDHPTWTSGAIQLNGGGSATRLQPLDDGSIWNNIVVFQDRLICLEAVFNGGGTTLEVRGLVYVPCGKVVANGDGGTIIVDQIIADTFQFNGGGGTLQVLFDESFVPSITLAGLVE